MQILQIYLTGVVITILIILYIIYRGVRKDQEENGGNSVNSSLTGEGTVLAGVIALAAGIFWVPLLILVLCCLVENLIVRG